MTSRENRCVVPGVTALTPPPARSSSFVTGADSRTCPPALVTSSAKARAMAT